MGYIVEITEKKVEKLSEHIEQGLRHLGKAMSCVEEWMSESGMSERSNGYGNRYGNRYEDMGSRGGYGNRGGMNYRDEDEWEEEQMMGERRRRRSNGRYY